jgi:hypothetical protein
MTSGIEVPEQRVDEISQDVESSDDLSIHNLESIASDFFETRRFLPPTEVKMNDDGIPIVEEDLSEEDDEKL